MYFAMEKIREGKAGGSERPCVWVLNPYELNAKEWKGTRDLANPHYLMDDDESWDYGDFLLAPKNFPRGPIAVYPIQRSNRVRAQRGWFTMHGSDRRGIEESVPKALWKIVLEKDAEAGALAFLEHAGLNAYTIYSDLDSLTRELHRKNRLL